jgi:thiamine-phosphate pyrophosphorylase
MATPAAAARLRRERAQRLRGIYAIVNDGDRALEIARAALGAGVGIVQYRAKHGIVADRLRSLREMTRQSNALLIVNDDWPAALAFDCDGVHLGPDDAGFAQVEPIRAALGDRLIGLSCGTIPEIEAAGAAAADYAGVGSVFATASKADAGTPIGIDGLVRIARATPLPVAAIGGIDRTNLAAVAATGVAMAAVIAAMGSAPDPAAAARELVGLWGAA